MTVIDTDVTDPNQWSDKATWRPSSDIDGSPGEADSGAIPVPGSIVINEVLAHSNIGDDWIELYNTTDTTIDISGWYLSDNDNNLPKYEIAPSTSIGAYSYRVFEEDLHFGPLSGALDPFSLSENGDDAVLSSANGSYVEVEAFGASQSDVAFGRYYKQSTQTTNFVAMISNTPNAENTYPKIGPIVINEIMYHPNDIYGYAEYVELKNITGSTIYLYDVNNNPWRFTDFGAINYNLPAGANIGPYGYLLLVKDIATFNAHYPGAPVSVIKCQWTSGRLNNDGEKIEIAMPGDIDQYGKRQYIRVDRVNYSNGSHPEDYDNIGYDPWPISSDGDGNSLTRIDPNSYGNDPNNWQNAPATPGQ